MTTINRRVNLARFGLSEKQLARLLPETIDGMILQAAVKTVEYLRREARRLKIKAFGRYIAGWQVQKSGNKTYLVINGVPYASFAESGRGPGKAPPVAAIKPWALLKFGTEKAAYPIARNIGQRGTVARDRFVSSGPKFDSKLRVIINRAARDVVGAALKRVYR